MVNLDAKQLRFMSTEEFRVLTAVEMGMKNHEIVPGPLIESLSCLKRGGAFKLLKMLAKNKLVAHQSIPYDGFRLTAKGYDFLALKSLAKRGTVSALGIQIGVGKESDIFTIMHTAGHEVCLKLHRLGRTCFRTVKNNRDYMREGQQHASWIYLSRLSALKEFAFMKALHAHGFPTPEPIDVNRHCVIMSLARGYQLNAIQELRHPALVFDRLMQLIVRLAEHGLIHCDFNEFNLLVDDDEQVTVIDFPQMISTSHINAEYYFDRDVNCVATFFRRRFGFCPAALPSLVEDVVVPEGVAALDEELAASGWTEAYSSDFGKLMATMTEEEAKAAEAAKAAGTNGAQAAGEDEEDEEDEEDGEEEEEEEEEADEAARMAAAAGQYAPYGSVQERALYGNRSAPVHGGNTDAELAKAAEAAEAAVAKAAAAAAAEAAAEAEAEAEAARAGVAGADGTPRQWAALEELGMDALGRLAMQATASADEAAPVMSFIGSPFCTKAEFEAYLALPPSEQPAALRAAWRGRATAAPSPPLPPLPARAADDDTQSEAASIRTTTSRASRRPVGEGPSERAAMARERAMLEFKKGRPKAKGSRNEAKDREKRKTMNGMKSELRGASAWG